MNYIGRQLLRFTAPRLTTAAQLRSALPTTTGWPTGDPDVNARATAGRFNDAGAVTSDPNNIATRGLQ